MGNGNSRNCGLTATARLYLVPKIEEGCMSHFENTAARVVLKKGRAKSVNNFHPWVFSGAVDRIEGEFEPGDIVPVVSYDGKFQAKGFVSPHSQIVVRILTFRDEPIDEDFFVNRLQQALALREALVAPRSNAYRVVHGDSDLLSGLVIDRYADAVVVQLVSRGVSRLREKWVEWIGELIHPRLIVERSETVGLEREGLIPTRQVLYGELEDAVEIVENGVRFQVDLWEGQKTGFFLDQRDNRERMAALSAGKRMLNCFSYTGGFSVAAALQGATTVSVEISEAAQETARTNFKLNGLNPDEHEFVVANVFEYLRSMQEEFDVIVLDPPAFVKKKANLTKGSRGYKDINRLAMEKIKPQGLLLSCSCSHYVDWDLFQKILFAAARESGRQVQIIGRFGQPPDHAINIYHPESEYLKSFLLRVV